MFESRLTSSVNGQHFFCVCFSSDCACVNTVGILASYYNAELYSLLFSCNKLPENYLQTVIYNVNTPTNEYIAMIRTLTHPVNGTYSSRLVGAFNQNKNESTRCKPTEHPQLALKMMPRRWQDITIRTVKLPPPPHIYARTAVSVTMRVERCHLEALYTCMCSLN